MNEIASLELLDAILAALNAVNVSANNVNPHIRFFDLASLLKSNGFIIRTPDFELALEKLEEDKFIKKVVGYETKAENPFEEKAYPAYAINFNGKYFIRNENGYAERQRRREANQIFQSNLDRQNRLNQKLLMWGAVGAALGALLLVIWEMGVHFCWW